ncbi:Copper chaperone CopZ [Corynebacterium provencense]|jgi:copper chaperone CopZ|uniref:Copper chaperone CopZ n=1 Tax=Corynebacterium provencense TaxID=1737425 RepID=A0A2Z3YXU6_9CORY|nr:cation transporter [Corynebacterium provencense]AWT27354.1 Copper chaperone CopZ [Corynebacterium provencense]MCI1256920.1 cation transporter [Corynebacterium provencense]
MTTRNYTVTGMTCGHCKASVEKEVGAIDGVTAAEATLSTGALTVTGDNFTDQQVAEAVDEAGYTVTPA